MKALILFFFCFNLYANDKILGFWLSENEKAVVEIYKKDQKFFGKLVWLRKEYSGEVPVALDVNNFDKELQKRKLNGLNILTDFVYEDGEYKDGEIYDPESGNTYSAYMVLENDNKIKLRGYIGFSFIGRTSYWARQKSAKPDNLEIKK